MPQALNFIGNDVVVEEAPGPIVVRGQDAQAFLDEIGRLLRFEREARDWYSGLITRLPAQTFFSLPSFP
jgi:hypothetical protein